MDKKSTSFKTKKARFCSKLNCIDDGDENKLKCVKCLKKKHYKCTGLPLYQVSQFLTKGYRGFICSQCVQVPSELEMLFITQEETMMEKLKREVSGCENIILKQKENEESLYKAIKMLNDEKSEQNQLDSLQQKIVSLERKIDESLAKSNGKNQTFADMVAKTKLDDNEGCGSIANNLRTIIAEERSKQQKEDEERRKRSNNIIIHGAMESDIEIKAVQKIFDTNLISTLLKDLQAEDVEIKSTERIGIRALGKDRPIKLVLDKESDKQAILKKLKNLKGKRTYIGVSITEDFTINERNTIKRWRQKMNEKNKEDINGNCWRLRGSPRTSLRLIKIDAEKDNQNIDQNCN